MPHPNALAAILFTLLLTGLPVHALAADTVRAADAPPPDVGSQLGVSLSPLLPGISWLRHVPAARGSGLTLPQGGGAATADIELRLEYGSPKGFYFPVGGLAYSLLLSKVHTRVDYPDGAAFNADSYGSFYRVYLPGIGWRGSSRSATFSVEIDPSVALFAYAGTLFAAPSGRFGGHRDPSTVIAVAALASVDATFLACTKTDVRRNGGFCAYAAPIVWQGSTAGPSEIFAGARFGVRFTF